MVDALLKRYTERDFKGCLVDDNSPTNLWFINETKQIVITENIKEFKIGEYTAFTTRLDYIEEFYFSGKFTAKIDSVKTVYTKRFTVSATPSKTEILHAATENY